MKALNTNSVSLNKHISNSGFCSRREADKLIDAGRVTLNGKRAATGNRVVEGDVVQIDGEYLQPVPKTIYIAFNKPVGVICTTDRKTNDNIVDFISHDERLFPIGRLDKDSDGLIFLTNDGDIVNKILRAGNEHEKEYIVTLNRPITAKFIREMSEGVEILGTKTKKCEVEQVNKNSFKIILVQGLNRQIRRMCRALGYKVIGLRRTRIMNVHLGKIKLGRWRKLTKVELTGINEMIANSSNAPAVTKRKKKKRRYPSKNSSPKAGHQPEKRESQERPKRGSKTQSFKKYRSNRKK